MAKEIAKGIQDELRIQIAKHYELVNKYMLIEKELANVKKSVKGLKKKTLDCWIELRLLHEFLNMLFYFRLEFQVNRSFLRDCFLGLKLLDESHQICLSRPFSIVLTISKAT
jgi:hypothetical protein